MTRACNYAFKPTAAGGLRAPVVVSSLRSSAPARRERWAAA